MTAALNLYDAARARLWQEAEEELELEGASWEGRDGISTRRAWKQREQSFPPPSRRLRGEGKAKKRRRSQRYKMREVSRRRSIHANVGKCGRVRYLAGKASVCLGPEGSAFFRGLCHCGSCWECPVDALAIAHGRAEELTKLVDRHRARGGAAYLVTFTLPHDCGDELGPMRRHVARAYQFVQSGAPWKRLKSRLELVGTVRALETTHGANGWHPHLHALFLPGRQLSALELEELRGFLLRRWRKAIARPNKDNGRTYRVPSDAHGVSVVESHRSDYIAKMGLADELAAGAWTKTARGSSRTPFRILADLTDAIARGEGDTPAAKRDGLLWDEYAREMFGARQLTWSKGLQKLYELDEQTDLELAAAEEKKPAETIYTFENAEWDDLVSEDSRLQCAILEAVESHPPPEALEAIIRLLDGARGLAPVPF